MGTYEYQIERFGHEIADDHIRRQENPEWEMTFDRVKVAASLSSIFGKDLMKTTYDLEDSIKKATKKIKANQESGLISKNNL